MTKIKRIVLTPGEPAGIGPDVTIQVAQQSWPHELVVIADPNLLLERAKQLNLPLNLSAVDFSTSPTPHLPGTLKIFPITLVSPVIPGQLNKLNAPYVLETLTKATEFCLNQTTHALVTGPVHKGILNAAGITFSGHTEFLAKLCQVKQTVMLFVLNDMKIALATTHLPLADVPKAISKPHLETIIRVLNMGLAQLFNIPQPRILVAGLNPHAGENGYLGREEIEVITPTIQQMRTQGFQLEGPLSADTIFLLQKTQQPDAILAMYHDQALPLVKYLAFDQAVNMTLGLPFVRTSVDHGTAIDLAGTGKSHAGSMQAALNLAMALQNSHR